MKTTPFPADRPRPVDGPLDLRLLLGNILGARPGTIQVDDREHGSGKRGFTVHVPHRQYTILLGIMADPATGRIGIEAWAFDAATRVCVRRERTEGDAAVERAYALLAQALRPHAVYCAAHPEEQTAPARETGRPRQEQGHQKQRTHRGSRGSRGRQRNGRRGGGRNGAKV